MASTPEKIIEYLRTIDLEYRDCRILTETELRSLVWFFLYGENVLSEIGWTWRGCTFRQSAETCLLVVKAGTRDTPQVAFFTARTPISCVLSFAKAWHNDRVKWSNDKFA
jgi:hypothetical protein